MSAYWLTYKPLTPSSPRGWRAEELTALVRRFERNGADATTLWRIASHQSAQVDDRVYLFKQGSDPKGIFGIGEIIEPPKLQIDPADTDSSPAYRAKIRLERLVDPNDEKFLIGFDAVSRIVPKTLITAQASGNNIPDEVAANLENYLAEMTGVGSSRNPSWNRDELILALELYRRHDGNPPGKTSKEVTELSKLLNKMGAQLSNGKADFRNPNGVYMKVMNFRRFDPVYLSQGKKGLERGNKLEAELWNKFANQADLLAGTAAAIRANVLTGLMVDVQDEDADDGFEAEEGRLLTRVHRARERSRKLVQQKKLLAIKKTGKLACEACNFEFEKTYGQHGAGFIEAHHVKPVHTLLPGQKTKLADLALLCANCHRMVHARKPWLSIEHLRQQLEGQKSGQSP